jgi:hypothetical protein
VNIRAVAEIIGYSANRLKQCFGRRIDRQPRQCFGVQATDGPMMICKNFFTFEKKSVMTAVELKNILIHKISAINDVSFLKAIQTIIDSKIEQKILPLTNQQRDEIMASKLEIEKGLYIEHETLDDEINVWLKEK